jgi:hypothetical protein
MGQLTPSPLRGRPPRSSPIQDCQRSCRRVHPTSDSAVAARTPVPARLQTLVRRRPGRSSRWRHERPSSRPPATRATTARCCAVGASGDLTRPPPRILASARTSWQQRRPAGAPRLRARPATIPPGPATESWSPTRLPSPAVTAPPIDPACSTTSMFVASTTEFVTDARGFACWARNSPTHKVSPPATAVTAPASSPRKPTTAGHADIIVHHLLGALNPLFHSARNTERGTAARPGSARSSA